MRYNIRKALEKMKVSRRKYSIPSTEFYDVPVDDDAVCFIDKSLAAKYQVYVKNEENEKKLFDNEIDALEHFFELISTHVKNENNENSENNKSKIPTIHRYRFLDIHRNSKKHNYCKEFMDIYKENDMNIIVIDFSEAEKTFFNFSFDNSIGRLIKTYGINFIEGRMFFENCDETIIYGVNCRCKFAQETYRKVHPLTTNDREVFLYQFIVAFDHEFNTDLVVRGSKIDLMKNIPAFEFDETDCAFDIKVKLLEQLSFYGCYAEQYVNEEENEEFKQQIRNVINKSLNTEFGQEDMKLIYQAFGFGGNTQFAREFVSSGYDMSILQ